MTFRNLSNARRCVCDPRLTEGSGILPDTGLADLVLVGWLLLNRDAGSYRLAAIGRSGVPMVRPRRRHVGSGLWSVDQLGLMIRLAPLGRAQTYAGTLDGPWDAPLSPHH
jgi:hypothetical protein